MKQEEGNSAVGHSVSVLVRSCLQAFAVKRHLNEEKCSFIGPNPT